MKKIIYRVLFISISILFLIIISIFSLFNLSKPSNNGIVNISNVLDSVTVLKDQWGIPHIEAKNQHDAIFTYGYTIAKDRLFQMDLQRRLARGELSEILGKDLVKIDKMLRTYMIVHHAEKYIADSSNISPEALKYVDAFIEGINYLIKTGPKSIEHQLIGAKVRPFDRVDVASMTIYMAFSFMDGMRRDMIYSMIKQKISVKNLAIIFPDYADQNYFTIQEANSDAIKKRNYDTSTGFVDDSSYNKLISFFDWSESINIYNPPFHGSNSWILSAERSQSGSPILANDPHIGISKPDVWYEAHISYPGFNTYGYYIPTIPFPLIGHDDFKAWGLTMTENDEVDLYAESFNPQNKNEVLYDNKWTKSKTIKETIKVKDDLEISFDIRKTTHGPIVSDYLEGYKGKPLAFSWAFYNLDNPIFDLLYELNNAKNITQFESSLSKLVSPGLNFSYADTLDNIAWWVAGRFPVRDSNIYAKAILDGNNPNHEIQSYVPFENNPHLINPENGVIVTANNLPSVKKVGAIPRLDGYYRSADRAQRIHNLLSNQNQWTVDELKTIQTDVFLNSGFEIKNEICATMNKFENSLSSFEKSILNSLNQWDGNMKTSSVGATIFQFSMYHIMKEALQPTLGKEYFRLYLNNPDHWDFFKNLIYSKIVPFKNEETNEYSDLILKGFKSAIKEMKTKLGKDLKKWNWGKVHTIEYEHPLGKVKPLNMILNLGPFSIDGGNNVINKIMSKPGDHNFKVTSLPSTRRIINLGNKENSYSMNPSGNSGNFWSDHYDNQVQPYIKGAYRKINFSKREVTNNAVKKLIIMPK
ncbi:penicillin acylase family protein [Bacteroidota bacterium]|nr:penicillin acylase family protein [Bacteroidota bacterium]